MTTTPPPLTRLDKAKAAHQKAQELYVRGMIATHEAERELADAEREAAAKPQPEPPPLPEALVEVASKYRNPVIWQMTNDCILELLAKSHGVSVEVLREAIK